MKEAFNDNKNYRLYRTLYDLVHPSISRKNISNYQIIIKEDFVPIRVFYPGKNIKLEKVIIYIHGETMIDSYSYSDVCRDLALHTDALVLGIDYHEAADKECQKLVQYIYRNIPDVKKDNITIMGDSRGADIVLKIIKDKENTVKKQILLYPTIEDSLTDINFLPTTLLISADLDPKKEIHKEYFNQINKVSKKSVYKNIKSVSFGFFVNPFNNKREECFQIIKKFIS